MGKSIKLNVAVLLTATLIFIAILAEHFFVLGKNINIAEYASFLICIACGILLYHCQKQKKHVPLAFVASLLFVLILLQDPVKLFLMALPGIGKFKDFNLFYKGAQYLYLQQLPLSQSGSNSFPFPTYYIVYLISAFLRFSPDLSGYIFTLLNLAALPLSALLLIRSFNLTSGKSNLAVILILLSLIFSEPTVYALGCGQTSPLILLFLSLGIYLWQKKDDFASMFFAGTCFSLCWMLKPHLVILIGYFLSCLLSDALKKEKYHLKEIGIFSTTIISGFLILGLTVLMPKGITLATYLEFMATFGQNVLVWSQRIYADNYSLIAIASKLTAGSAVPLSASFLSAGTLLLFGSLNILLQLKTRSKASMLFFCPWIFLTLISTPIVWRHYALWAYPGIIYLGIYILKAEKLPGYFGFIFFAALSFYQIRFTPLFSLSFVVFYLLSILLIIEEAPRATTNKIPCPNELMSS